PLARLSAHSCANCARSSDQVRSGSGGFTFSSARIALCAAVIPTNTPVSPGSAGKGPSSPPPEPPSGEVEPPAVLEPPALAAPSSSQGTLHSATRSSRRAGLPRRWEAVPARKPPAVRRSVGTEAGSGDGEGRDGARARESGIGNR